MTAEGTGVRRSEMNAGKFNRAGAGMKERGMRLRALVCLLAMLVSMWNGAAFAASAFHGQVTFNGLPVPGATVTATQGDQKMVAVTDAQGTYAFADLPDGAWKFQVEMSGFETQTQDVTVSADSSGPTWELKLLPLAEITHGAPPVAIETQPEPSAATTAPAGAPAAAPGNGAANSNGNSKGNSAQPAGQVAQAAPAQAPAQATTGSNDSSSDVNQSAATGLVVNGSVNNGAASAYAQMAAFGNNRRGPGSLYNGFLGVTFDTSAWDARSFSQTGIATPKPSYNDTTVFAALGGPLGLPHHLIANSNFFVAYQHQANSTATTLTGLVPTLLQRNGDFSQTLNAAGQPVQIFQPGTNTPFAGNVVPVSAQAQALLGLYPKPNAAGLYNYQTPGLNSTDSNSLTSRVTKGKGRNSFFGTYASQWQTGTSNNLFGFVDGTKTLGMDGTINWQRFYRPGGVGYLTTNLKYEFSRQATSITPYFANRANVSGAAGIAGNDQSPQNWGPPSLSFASGIAGLADSAQFARNANQTQALSYSSLWYRGKHSLQFGGDVRRLQFNVVQQQDARGQFGFTGTSTAQTAGGVAVPGTGSDFADFLLGTPDTAQIAFGNADKYLRGWSDDAFVTDDWHVRAGLTLNVGLRWEFAKPLTELKDRLVNLDIAPGFGAAAPVLAGSPTGTVTGTQYPSALLHADYRAGIEPRLSMAWRPRSNSPLVVRAGYGIYDVTSVYQTIALQLAQQPPLSKTLSLQNTLATPLTLAGAFNSVPVANANTFAVDPNFRLGYLQAWNASVQQDLPFSLTMTATYLGMKGTHLMQESLPNTYAVGATNPCLACPAGFIFLSSNGNSTRNAGQIQVRRRLHNGITATVQYTYAKALDDASAFSAASLGTAGGPSLSSAASSAGGRASIAQNWLDLRAERGPSAFDQRHLLSVTGQYTSGEGLRGGALMSGWKGTLLREWTVQTTLTLGSGLPLTPVYPVNVPGTGFTGTIRPELTGAPIYAAGGGRHLNPAAFAAPTSGQWGNAGRNSIVGPSQFGLNASISRVFRLNNRLNAQWETDATNVLNTVTFSSWDTSVGSPLFGLPSSWNGMRKLQTTFRLRF